jgi:hypothetical protein
MNSTNINSEFEFEFKMEIQNGKEKEIKKRGREATWASDPISAQNPLLTRVSRPIPPQPLGLTLTDMWTRGSAFYASRRSLPRRACDLRVGPSCHGYPLRGACAQETESAHQPPGSPRKWRS